MVFLKLFLSFFQVGLFSFGGGMAALPLIQTQMVEIHGWLTLSQFADLVTIAEMTPGPIAINAATFVGIRVAGLPGALVATFGCVLPSCVIVLILARLYVRYKSLSLMQGALGGLRPAIVALIGSAGMSIFLMAICGEGGFHGLDSVNWIAVGMFAVAFVLLRKWKVSPILLMLCSGVAGGILYTLFPALAG